MDLNLHIYPSYLTNESRILRETQSLCSLGLVKKIFVLGYWKAGLAEQEEVLPSVFFYRLRPPLKKQEGIWKILNLISFPLFYLEVISICRKNRPSLINCHTLTVLPLGFFLKHLFGARLIYDPHELETESNESKGSRRIMARFIERSFIHSADAVIVVSHHIAKWYITKYNLTNVSVVKNIPRRKVMPATSSLLRQAVGLSEKDIVFLYVGVLENGRGIHLLLDIFKGMRGNKHLVFLGYGALQEEIKNAADSNNNIHYQNAVSPDRVLEYVAGADVGICLIENTCLSYYYCLPNKSFEYICAGLPFISSNFPELKQEFGSYGVCWFTDVESEQISKLINRITAKDIAAKRKDVLMCRENWSWEEEEKKYFKILTL